MRARRILLGLAFFLAITAMAAFLLRLPVAGHVVRGALANAGLDAVHLRVTALSLSGARLENLSAGPEGDEAFRVDFIEADFEWGRLLRQREIDALRIGPGAIRLVVSPEGKVSLPGIVLPGGGGGDELPVGSLTIAELALNIDTPVGAATGMVSADIDVQTGGSASITLSASKAGLSALIFENASARAELIYDPASGARLEGSIVSDILADALMARGANIDMSARNLSWSESNAGAARTITGEATFNLDIADIPVENSPLLAAAKTSRASFLVGEPLNTLSFSGAVTATSSQSGVTIGEFTKSNPITIKSDTGVALVITSLDGASFYKRENGTDRAAFNYRLTGTKTDAQGAVEAEMTDANWRVAAPLRLGAYHSGRLSFDTATLNIDATSNARETNAKIDVAVTLKNGKVGRLNIFDVPIAASFNIVAGHDTHRAIVTSADECIFLDRLRATIDRQDTEIRLSDAAFCAGDEPVAVVDWSDVLQSTFAGTVSASHARYRLGNTRMIGQPPQLEFAAVYTPSLNRTSITGNVDGGNLALNEILDLAQTTGQFTFSLDKEIMRVDLRAEKTRVSQHRDLPLVAPVLAAVDFSLIDKNASFDYVLTTLSGRRIGAGSGVHDVTTSAGKSRLVLDDLEFTPNGLQPAALLPVMRGFVREAIGGATGTADFLWTRSSGITGSSDIELKNMTFSGPGRIANLTKGLNGNIQFKDLWPLTTAGVQTVTVEGADLDALKLQHGEIAFEMRGDETLRVKHAAFPWFGGALGADDAVMSLAGGEAVTPLSADRIDLGQIFEFADFEGLSGEGILSGVLPLVVKDGRARIENGVLKSDSPGVIRYQGRAGEEAAAAGGQAKIAFDLLRDFRFNTLVATINGPLDGRLVFEIDLDGTGQIEFNNQDARVPVKYHINLDAALLELLNQANLSRRIELQVQRGINGQD